MAFDKDNNVVFILASPFMLLRSTDPLNIQAFADGYFNVPKGYYQLYAIQIYDSQTLTYIPCVYFLLSKKI